MPATSLAESHHQPFTRPDRLSKTEMENSAGKRKQNEQSDGKLPCKLPQMKHNDKVVEENSNNRVHRQSALLREKEKSSWIDNSMLELIVCVCVWSVPSPRRTLAELVTLPVKHRWSGASGIDETKRADETRHWPEEEVKSQVCGVHSASAHYTIASWPVAREVRRACRCNLIGARSTKLTVLT